MILGDVHILGERVPLSDALPLFKKIQDSSKRLADYPIDHGENVRYFFTKKNNKYTIHSYLSETLLVAKYGKPFFVGNAEWSFAKALSDVDFMYLGVSMLLAVLPSPYNHQCLKLSSVETHNLLAMYLEDPMAFEAKTVLLGDVYSSLNDFFCTTLPMHELELL